MINGVEMFTLLIHPIYILAFLSNPQGFHFEISAGYASERQGPGEEKCVGAV